MANLKSYLLDNPTELRSIVSELNSWNGCLESYQVYENDEDFFNMFFEGKTVEAVRATQYGEYNYNDEYVQFNGYGNLDSFTEHAYEKLLSDNIEEIIAELIENKDNVDLDSELEDLITEWDSTSQ